MVKRLTLIFLLLAGSAGATITISNDTLLSQIPITTSDSNVTIAGTAVITVDATREFRLWSQGSGTRLRFSNTGHTVTMGGLRNLGRIDTIGSTDALEIKNRDLIAADSDLVCWGAGSIIVSGNASRAAVIRGVSVGGVKPTFMYRSTSGNFKLSGCTISGFRQDFGSGYVGGLNLLPATNRTVSSRDVYFINVTFDSCAVHVGRTQTLRGFRMDNCTFNLSNLDGFIRTVSPCDTFYRVRVLHNHNAAAASGYGFLLDAGADSAYVYGCHVDPLGASGENTLDRGIQVNAAYVKMDRDTVHNCRFNILTTSSNSHGGQLYNSVLYGASHEQLHWESAAADSNWIVQGNLIYSGGARSLVTVYRSGASVMKNLNFSYNTVVSTGGGKSAFGWDCPAGTGCASTATGLVFVGNIFAGANPSYSSADMLLDGYTLTFTEFKKNVISNIDTTRLGNSGDISVPYSITDSNTISSAFGFVDSANSDYRLSGTSPILNCGDSAYFVQVFSNTNPKGDPGYYQSYTTGTCGSSSPTPTGACCIAYTCYPGYTSAQCTSQGGTYQGDGTTTCTSCTAPGGNVGTGYGKRSWATFATLNYGDASYNLPSLAPTVAHYMDISVNLSGAMKTAVQALDPNIGVVPYHLSATLYPEDTAEWRTYATANGYNFDSGFIWADGATACINPINPTANGICVGNTICTPSGQKMTICAWNTIRLIPNFRYQGMLNFIKSKFHSDASGTGNRGLMNDEATFQWQDTLTHHQTNSAWFPFPGYWSSGSAANTNAWTGSGLTNTQIADSLIRMRRTGWYKEVIDSFKVLGKQVYMNGAAYGQMTSDIAGDMATLGSGALWGETENIALGTANGYYSGLAWTMMDSLRIGGRKWQEAQAIVWTNINATDTATLTAIDGALGMKRRLAQERYCWYMMAQTPLRSFLFISLNWAGLGHQNGWSIASDSLFKVCPSMDAPLGAPSGARSVLSSGTGGTVYQRSFANGKVLWRDGSGGSYTSANAITVALGATYYPVNYDGTYGTPTSTASIRNGEGLVFITSTSSATGTLSIDNPTTPEGGNMVFTVTLSPAQTVPVSVNYITSPGSGAAITDYTDQSGTISFGIDQTTATISIPTVDRAGCLPSRTFNVTLYGASPGTSITIPSPQATGTITDGDCGTPYNRTYKGKIVIKGKVRP